MTDHHDFYQAVWRLEQPYADREARWQEAEAFIDAQENVNGFTPVEPAVRELAVALHALGIPAYASCEGHPVVGSRPYIALGLRAFPPSRFAAERNARYRLQMQILVRRFQARDPEPSSHLRLILDDPREDGTFTLEYATNLFWDAQSVRSQAMRAALKEQQERLERFGAFVRAVFFATE